MILASFPYEEDANIEKKRPVIVIDKDRLEVLVVKVTTHAPRPNDPFDVPLFKWAEAGLKEPSVARVAKTIVIQQSKVDRKLGQLTASDLTAVLQALARFHN